MLFLVIYIIIYDIYMCVCICIYVYIYIYLYSRFFFEQQAIARAAFKIWCFISLVKESDIIFESNYIMSL